MERGLLLKDFTVTENPGLSLVDPRFNELSTHIQSGDFNQVTVLAESVISEEIYDIRVNCYYLYGLFLEAGPSAMPEIFQSVIKMLSANWDAVGPVKNKEKQYTNSLAWLLKQLGRKIDYEEKKQSPEWERWQKGTDADQVSEALDLCEELRKNTSLKLEDLASHLNDGVASLKTWLGGFYRLVYKAPEPEAEPEEEPEPAPAETEERPEPAAPAAQAFEFKGNYHLARLRQKIAAFKKLIEKEKYEQAALVGFDIEEIIANFDPRIYFPEIFSEFSLLYSMNIQELLSSKLYVQTAEWKSLKELYKVDIDRFAAMELNIDFSQAAAESGPDDPESGGYDDGY